MRIYLSLLAIIFFSCGREQPIYAIDLSKQVVEDSMLNEVKRYGIAYNPVRFKRSVPLLLDSFVLHSYGLDHASWQNRYPDKRPIQHNKLVVWSTDSVVYERNVFLGPKNEMLIIAYSVPEDSPGYYKPGYKLSSGLTQYFPGDSSLRTDLTIEQADSMLQSWSLNVD